MTASLTRRAELAVAAQPHVALLAARLRCFGGTVVPANEERLGFILRAGRIRAPTRIDVRRGDSSAQVNSALLWESNPDLGLVIGWALGSDDAWRRHAWCEDRTVLIETTDAQRMYFGARLSPAESCDFAFMTL